MTILSDVLKLLWNSLKPGISLAPGICLMVIFSPKNGSSCSAIIAAHWLVPAPGFCGTTNIIS